MTARKLFIHRQIMTFASRPVWKAISLELYTTALLHQVHLIRLIKYISFQSPVTTALSAKMYFCNLISSIIQVHPIKLNTTFKSPSHHSLLFNPMLIVGCGTKQNTPLKQTEHSCRKDVFPNRAEWAREGEVTSSEICQRVINQPICAGSHQPIVSKTICCHQTICHRDVI